MKKLYKSVLASLFAAVITVSTIAVHIPMPGVGYINPGDAFGLSAGILLGPVYGAVAAGIGGALSDLILGYSVYIPATAVIKSACAVIAYFIYKALRRRKTAAGIAACVGSEAVMIAGYFIYEFLVLGYREAAVPNIAFNAIQGVFSTVVAVIIIITADKLKFSERIK